MKIALSSYAFLLIFLQSAAAISNNCQSLGIDPSPKNSHKYEMVKINDWKLQEDKTKNIKFFNVAEREKTRVLIVKGIFYTAQCDLISESENTHNNTINYVMDDSGNFYLFDEFSNKEIKHSSIFAGGPVAGAGEISIQDGKAVILNSNSGHYPTIKVFKNVLVELGLDGVDVSTLAVN